MALPSASSVPSRVRLGAFVVVLVLALVEVAFGGPSLAALAMALLGAAMLAGEMGERADGDGPRQAWRVAQVAGLVVSALLLAARFAQRAGLF